MSRKLRPVRIGWFRAVARYYRDPDASVLGKLVFFVALAYAIVPVDLVPDVPIVGWLDDLGLLGLATAWLSRVASRYRAPEGLSQGRGSSAEAERRRLSTNP